MHDEFMGDSLNLLRKNNLHFHRYMKNAENHDDSRQNYAEQALNNCVTFCHLLNLTWLDRIVNIDEVAALFTRSQTPQAAVDAKIVDTLWNRIEERLAPVIELYNKVAAEKK
jgi:hypothetical protein